LPASENLHKAQSTKHKAQSTKHKAQNPNLPHCNGNGWFTSKSSRNSDNAALTLCAITGREQMQHQAKPTLSPHHLVGAGEQERRIYQPGAL
jgi:hypothetical protein